MRPTSCAPTMTAMSNKTKRRQPKRDTITAESRARAHSFPLTYRPKRRIGAIVMQALQVLAYLR